MMIDIPDELWAAYDSASDERIWNAHGEIGERYIRASLHEQQIQEWQEHHKAETDRLYERIAELEAALERVNSQIAKAWNDIGSPACDAAPIPWMARTIKNWSIAQKKSDAALVAATDRVRELEAEVESHDEEAQRWIRWNKMLIAEGKYKIGKLLYFIEEAVSAYPDLERLRSYPSLSDYYVGVGESYPGPKEE